MGRSGPTRQHQDGVTWAASEFPSTLSDMPVGRIGLPALQIKIPDLVQLKCPLTARDNVPAPSLG